MNDYFHALKEVVLSINSSLDPGEVLQKVTEKTASAMGCKACTIRLLDPSGHFLIPSAAFGLSPEYMRKGPVEIRRSGMDSEVMSGHCLQLKDATADGRFQYPEAAKAEGLVSVLSAPLMTAQGQAIGLIRVYSSVEREFTGKEITFMEAVAAVSAIAIENSRLHEALRSNYELMAQHQYSLYDD